MATDDKASLDEGETRRILEEIRDLLREILINQRMTILRDRAAVNVKERALQSLTDELFAYIHQRRLLNETSWWVSSETIILRDLRTLLNRYQRREVHLTWGDLLAELETQPEGPLRDKAKELADFMLRRETGD